MSMNDENGKTPEAAAEHLKRIEKHLAEEDQRLDELKEEIREADGKSKVVDPDPEP